MVWCDSDVRGSLWIVCGIHLECYDRPHISQEPIAVDCDRLRCAYSFFVVEKLQVLGSDFFVWDFCARVCSGVYNLRLFSTLFVELSHDAKMVKLDTYPLFLGNAAFLYLISTAVLPMEQGMQDRTSFHKPFTLSLVLVTVVNLAFGFIAYLAYGDCDNCSDPDVVSCCTQSNVISNISTHGSKGIVAAVKILLTIDLFFTTMLFLFPMTELLERALFDEVNFGRWRTEILRNTLRGSVVVVIGLIAKGIPIFGLLTGLSGGFGNNIIGLILPPLMYYQLRNQNGYWKSMTWSNIMSGNKESITLLLETIGLIVVFLLGVTVLILSTTAFVEAIAAPAKNHTATNTTSASPLWMSDDL
eukprot:m.189717 g.189717  ORF g.189717 m.189717 type:complete len:358 (-) comp32385_c1_seq1:415-1488(-)